MKKIVILISGRGSNMQAILEARPPLKVAAVISNEPQAAGLAIAHRHGVATRVVNHRGHADRATFETMLAQTLDTFAPDLIVLAGFMRVLGAAFVARYAGRMLNIHPSLLPSYPGLDTHKRALADGVRVHGCTVHFVTADVDHGPIVMQGAVAVHDGDDEEKLAARVLAVEHQLLPAAVRAFCEGRLVIAGRRVCVKGEVAPAAALMVPLPIPPVGAAAGDRPHAS